jgi:AraC-like DNA-binding protein
MLSPAFVRPTFLRHAALPGAEIRVVHGRGERSPPTPPMITSDLKVALVLRGANRLLYRGSSWIAAGGTLILAEPGETHAVESVEGAFDVHVLSVNIETVSELTRADADGLRDGVSFRGPLTRDLRAVRAFRALASALGDPTSESLLVEERLMSTLEALSRAYAGRAATPAPSDDARSVGRARARLDDMFQESVTLDALAAESGLPKPRFLRAFKRLVRVAPHAYQVQLRVDHARRLLAEGREIADAASAAGFFDQSHLHRHFRRLIGLTPAEYRNRSNPRARTYKKGGPRRS